MAIRAFAIAQLDRPSSLASDDRVATIFVNSWAHQKCVPGTLISHLSSDLSSHLIYYSILFTSIRIPYASLCILCFSIMGRAKPKEPLCSRGGRGKSPPPPGQTKTPGDL